MFSIEQTPIQATSLSSELVHNSAGALCTFEGWVRDKNDGQAVISLEYECFAALAEKEGAKIIEEAKQKFDIVEASCRHRVGTLMVGDLAVWVGATAVHRAAAFAACRYVIDEIKLRLPVWKKEHYVDGSATWVNCSAHEHQKHPIADAASTRELQATQMPAVAPPAVTISESAFYARQTILPEIGDKGQSRLKTSSVLVIGAGGTGCPALQYLIGAGVGKIGICDFDRVEISNLHRQPLYTTADLGKRKAEAAAERLRAANPFVLVQTIAQKFDHAMSSRLVRDYDVILDCTDNLDAKFCIADACHAQSKILLQASVHGFEGELSLWHPKAAALTTASTATTETTKDKTIACQSANNHSDYSGQCYRCLWPSAEALQKNGRDCVASCAESGVLGAVPGMLGVMQAVETIKILLGLESALSTHVLLVDMHTLSISKIKVRRAADCPACGAAQSTASPTTRAATTPSAATSNLATATDSEAKYPYVAASPDVTEEFNDEHEFELHWNILQSRSPRDLVYVDIRSKKEIDEDPTTRNKLKGRQLLEWPGDTLNLTEVPLDRNLTYLFICQRGKRSGTMVRKLRSLGHRNVFSLSEGVESMSPQKSERAKV